MFAQNPSLCVGRCSHRWTWTPTASVGSRRLDDLDLDTDISETYFFLEWGEGLAESLSGDRLELSLKRTADDERTVALTPVGPRWRELDYGGVASPAGETRWSSSERSERMVETTLVMPEGSRTPLG